MKILFLLLLSSTAFANYSKPQMMARYGGLDHYNSDYGLNCYTSDPVEFDGSVFMACHQNAQSVLAKFGAQFEILAKHENNLFSSPKVVESVLSWYEFSEAGMSYFNELKTDIYNRVKLEKLGPSFSRVDSFVRIKDGRYIYRVEEDSKYLNAWFLNESNSFFQSEVSHIFPPVSSVSGELVFKTRLKNLSESAPDELIYWNGEFQKLLVDQDHDSNSTVISFRHQYDVDKGVVALVIKDTEGEALALVSKNEMKIIARAGVDLKSFEFFAPKIRDGLVVFRGVDFNNRKALYAYQAGELTQILTQGDIVQTEKGPAQINYKTQDAIFFSAPGIGAKKTIYQQVTLSDLDQSMTLLGIALIKIEVE